MKNLKIFLIFGLALLLAMSCKDDKDKVVLKTSDAIAPSLVTPANGSSYQLNKAEGDSAFENFVWTAADYGTILSNEYTVQLDVDGSDFSNAINLGKTIELTLGVSNAVLNLYLYDAGYRESATVNFRVNSIVKNNAVDTLISDNNAVSVAMYAFNKPNFSDPANGGNYVLTKADADKEFDTFTWDAVDYGSAFGKRYTIEFDNEGNNFGKPITLKSGLSDPTFSITVGELNALLIKKGFEVNKPLDLEFRVVATANPKSGVIYGDPISLSIKTYSDEGGGDEEPELIYMLGGATTAGWTNSADLNIPAYYQPSTGDDSTFTAVDLLTPNGEGTSDGFIKFVRINGAWAPQWGSDGAGTWESGVMVYRAVDTDPDPTPIPAPDVAGDYLVKANIVSLSYSIEKVTETLYLIGDATEAGWDNTAAIAFTKDKPGVFSLVANLDATASEGFKFLVTLGEWEPMYGRVADEPWEGGYLAYRPVGTADVASIPPPSESGSYLIVVDLAKNTYTLTLQ